MVEIGFHASHEQRLPSTLLRDVVTAEKAGFQAAMCSDHFHPWGERQGQSGYAWSWLGAALQATGLSFGTVCAPGQRYHPAVVAQGAATLAEMYPGRFWLAIGSGEALNESITGAPWPPKPQRNARLREAADVIRALWAGETVDHNGHFQVSAAKLYTRPARPPLLIGAALTTDTARWMGSWADGLITAGSSHDSLKEVADAFRDGGGAGKPLMLQAAMCYGQTREQAQRDAHDQWRNAALDASQISDLPTPVQFDQAAATAQPADMGTNLRISDSAAELYDGVMRDAELGFKRVFVHHVGRAMERFIAEFGAQLGK